MPTSDATLVGRQLRYWRERAGIKNQLPVAEAIGVTQQTVSDWERGLSAPHFSKARALDECFGLPKGMTGALLSGDRPPADAGEDPLAVDLQDGELIWTARIPVGAAALSGVDIARLSEHDIETLRALAELPAKEREAIRAQIDQINARGGD